MMGECVPIENVKVVRHGGWGEWSSWSVCNKICNGGIQYTERRCDNPTPSHGGDYCIGERKRYKVCNTQVCQNYLCLVFSHLIIEFITHKELSQ